MRAGVLHGVRRRAAASTSRWPARRSTRASRAGRRWSRRNFVIPYPPGFPIMVPGPGDRRRHDRVHAQARRQGDPRLRREPRPQADPPVGAGRADDARLGARDARSRSRGRRKAAPMKPPRLPAANRSHGAHTVRRGPVTAPDRRANMIDWFFATLRPYPEIAIFLTLALGYYFGKFTFKGIGLGAVTATLLAGVADRTDRDHDLAAAQGDRLPACSCSPSATASGRSSCAASPRTACRRRSSRWSSACSAWWSPS